MSTALTTLTNNLATRLNMGGDGSELINVLKATAFKGQVTDAQMTALMVVANQYGLNPWTKEVYAFPDKNNGIVPVVGVDGWSRIMNDHPQFDGMEFIQDDESCTCIIYRKDRAHPIRATEYMDECKRGTGPWQSHPKRMLRHKSMIQCARLAFGFGGIYDQDEAERIVEIVDTNTGEVRRGPAKAAAAKVADDYDAFEAEHLPALQAAAMEGQDALQAAFTAIPKTSNKATLWSRHSASLKAAAVESGNIIEAEVVA